MRTRMLRSIFVAIFVVCTVAVSTSAFAIQNEIGELKTIPLIDPDSNATGPTVAWDGFNHGVAWTNTNIEDNSTTVYFTKVLNEAIRDEMVYIPFRISNITDPIRTDASSPRLVWNGEGYGIVWVEKTTEMRPNEEICHLEEVQPIASEIHFAQLDADGHKNSEKIIQSVDASTLEISNITPLIWNDRDQVYAIAWSVSSRQQDCGTKLYFAKINPLNEEVAPIYLGKYPSVYCNSLALNSAVPKYSIVWATQSGMEINVYFLELDNDEITALEAELRNPFPMGPRPVIIDSFTISEGGQISEPPYIAWNNIDNVYGVVWTREITTYSPLPANVPGPSYRIYFMEIDPNNICLDAERKREISTYNYTRPMCPKALIWENDMYGLLGYTSNWEMFFSQLDTQGNVMSYTYIHWVTEPYRRNNVGLVWTGSKHSVFWSDINYDLINEVGNPNSIIYYKEPDINHIPVSNPLWVTAVEDHNPPIILTASDIDGDPLEFSIINYPTYGRLSGTPPNVTYEPNKDYNGPDSFTYSAYDGQAYSAPATVSITVNPVNDPPVANNQAIETREDQPIIFNLDASDPDGDTLSYNITLPANGTLAENGPTLTYTPKLNFNGPDSFRYNVSDGQVNSAPATISITVKPVNDAPVLENIPEQTVTVRRRLTFNVIATDVDKNDNLVITAAIPQEAAAQGAQFLHARSNQRLETGVKVKCVFNWPRPTIVGDYVVAFTVRDRNRSSNTMRVTIHVLPR